MKKFIGLLLFSSFAISAYAEDSKLWVMLDQNNQRSERDKARELAQKSGAEIKIFPNVGEWEKWLAVSNNSQRSVDTIIASGHAMGSEFFSEKGAGLSVNRLSEIAKSNPGVAQTEAFYALGCYTSTTSSARLWARTLPNLRYIAGFDGSGPSHDPSVQFLEEVEKVRPQLGPEKTPEELRVELERSFVYKNKKGQWGTNGAVGVLDRTNERMHFMSKPGGNEELPFGPPDVAGCKKALDEIEAIIKPSKSIDTFITDTYNGGTPAKCDQLKELPPAGNQSSDLRRLYAKMQRIEVCDQDVILTDPFLGKRTLNIMGIPQGANEEEEEMSYRSEQMGYYFTSRRMQMIVFIHQEQILKNFMECAEPFLGAVKERAKACLDRREGAAVENAVNKRPVGRQSTCEMLQTLGQHGEWKAFSEMMSKNLLENQDAWQLGDMSLWDPLTNANRAQVCGKLSLNDKKLVKAIGNRERVPRRQQGYGRCRELTSVIDAKGMVGKYNEDGTVNYVETSMEWSQHLLGGEPLWGEFFGENFGGETGAGALEGDVIHD